ncbi:unnamed protein product [Wuchereria bancrofti]|uniref:Protein-tyrosine phosphatase n=1 Tax=Wuchereria bancrofti TaxID=6293 RepID=A0A3P7GGF0_WUCBA|nr:unnamed protein product [Wuchereria bancrofti]
MFATYSHLTLTSFSLLSSLPLNDWLLKGLMSRRSSEETSGKNHKVYQNAKKVKRKNYQKKINKQNDERSHLVRIPGPSNHSRRQHFIKVKHRIANSYPDQRQSTLAFERSISEATTFSTVTGRDETETVDSPSTSSSGSKRKTKATKARRHQTESKNRLIQKTLILIHSPADSQSTIINLQCNRTSMETLIAQYERIQTIKPSKAKAFIGMLPVNHHKNRYSDVYCLDSSRVILCRGVGDYIHANYVRHKVLQNDFILTQGPLPNTVNDFWEMVWQERSGLIFMLCKYIEEHKVKCAEYLPTLQTRTIMHAGIRIELRERNRSKNGNIIITQLLLSRGNVNLTVMHYQWISWADKQVPVNDYNTPFYLLKKSRISPTCTVVHCSAGIGRSGTLVAIELCLMQLVAGNELVVSDMVTYIRQKRAQSVQTKEQYLYIFRALLEFAVSNHITCARKINPFAERYRQICHFDET